VVEEQKPDEPHRVILISIDDSWAVPIAENAGPVGWLASP